jgi:site-specific recombinase XerD
VWRKRLAAVGLIDAPERAARLTLKPFLDAYMANRADIKPGTRVALGQTIGYLTEFFGPDKGLEHITPGDADEWRQFLIGTKGLADNTVRRRCGAAKQFFKAAVRKRLLTENSFADLKAAVQGNREREYFVTRAEAEKVLDACPDCRVAADLRPVPLWGPALPKRSADADVGRYSLGRRYDDGAFPQN